MRENSPSHDFTGRALSWLLPFLLISAAYLYAFPQPTVFYAGVVLLHAFSGVVAAVLLVPALIRVLRNGSSLARAGWLLVAAGAVLGLILIKTGTPRTEWNVALHAYRDLARRSRPSDRRPAWTARMVGLACGRFDFAHRDLPGVARRALATEHVTFARAGKRAGESRIRRCRPTT